MGLTSFQVLVMVSHFDVRTPPVVASLAIPCGRPRTYDTSAKNEFPFIHLLENSVQRKAIDKRDDFARIALRTDFVDTHRGW